MPVVSSQTGETVARERAPFMRYLRISCTTPRTRRASLASWPYALTTRMPCRVWVSMLLNSPDT